MPLRDALARLLVAEVHARAEAIAGEARARVVRLVPGAVVALRVDQEADAAPQSCARSRGCRVATSASSAQPVCDAVLGPRPRKLSSMYEAQVSPQPPSAFWCATSHSAALRTYSCDMSSPIAASAGNTAAGAVDVVDAPAAEPAAVRLLLGADRT